MFFLLFVSSSHLPTPPLAVLSFFFEFLSLVFLLLLLPFTTYSTTTTLECWPAAFSSPDELVVASSFVNAFQMSGPPDRKGRKKKRNKKTQEKYEGHAATLHQKAILQVRRDIYPPGKPER